jgi:hypothetical protein
MKITKIWRFVKLKVNILVVIGTDCTGRCKSNYHTITTTTAPNTNMKSLNSNTKWANNDDSVTSIELLIHVGHCDISASSK